MFSDKESQRQTIQHSQTHFTFPHTIRTYSIVRQPPPHSGKPIATISAPRWESQLRQPRPLLGAEDLAAG